MVVVNYFEINTRNSNFQIKTWFSFEYHQVQFQNKNLA